MMTGRMCCVTMFSRYGARVLTATFVYWWSDVGVLERTVMSHRSDVCVPTFTVVSYWYDVRILIFPVLLV